MAAASGRGSDQRPVSCGRPFSFRPAARAAGRLGVLAERGVCSKSFGAMSTVFAVFADFADVYFRERVFGAKNELPKTAISAKNAKTAPPRLSSRGLDSHGAEGPACPRWRMQIPRRQGIKGSE